MNDASFFFKVRDQKTGLFSPGGSDALSKWEKGQWSKTGKTWGSLGALKNHLRMFIRRAGSWPNYWDENNIPEAWEVVKIKVEYSQQDVIEARGMLTLRNNPNE